jgi:tryptophan synthase beta chain
MHANLYVSERAKFEYVKDDEALAACFELCKLEGIIPALESSHALAVLDKIEMKPEDVVVVNLSGRGDKDLETLVKYVK